MSDRIANEREDRKKRPAKHHGQNVANLKKSVSQKLLQKKKNRNNSRIVLCHNTSTSAPNILIAGS